MKAFSFVGVLLLSSHMLMGQLGDMKLTDALKTGNSDVYGTYCGFAGTPPEARQDVEKLIHARDIASLESPILRYHHNSRVITKDRRSEKHGGQNPNLSRMRT